jgi:hypothetical protein
MSAPRFSGVLLASAAVVLFGTAALHGTGYRPISDMLAASGMSPMWASGLRMLWLDFSFHLILVGVFYLVAALNSAVAGRPALFVVSLLPAVDTVLLYATIGVFPGSLLLTFATLLIWLAIALRPTAPMQQRAS